MHPTAAERPRVMASVRPSLDMASTEPAPEFKASHFTEQRNDALREGVKGLFLMNGGGAAALLVFLQAIWTDNPRLA